MVAPGPFRPTLGGPTEAVHVMNISHSIPVARPQRSSWLETAWRALVEPPASILVAEKRHNARLLSSVLVCLFVVYLLFNLAYAVSVPGYRITPSELIGGMLLLAIYLTSRSRFTDAAVAALLVAFPLNVFSNVLDGISPIPAVALAFLAPAFILASIFLNAYWTAIYGYAVSSLVLLLPLLMPRAVPDFRSVLPPFAAGVLTVTLCIVAMLHRQKIEGEQRAALRRDYNSTLAGWSQALEIRDSETHGHSHRVTELTLQLARACGIRENELEYIYQGAMLHDIGKMAIPDKILFKDSLLTEDEWEVMRTHPKVAYDMLSSISFLEKALVIPAYHHEWWDGGGYPFGLRGREIPLPARVFAVVDVWDALLSDRPYRKAWDRERVVQHFREQAGRQFDPEIVERFLTLQHAGE